MKIRDMSRNTWSKEWLQALKLRAISFLVLWSWPRSTSHNKGNIKLRTSRALRVCTIVMHCSFGFVLCHRDSPIICLGEHLFTFFHFEKIRDILMNTSNKEWLQALKLRAISFLVLWSLPQSNSHDYREHENWERVGLFKCARLFCIVLLVF